MKDKTNSPEEILDLVDKNDKVIGEVVRLQADSNPFFTYRQSSVLIFDSDNRILLHQRSALKKTIPLHWSVSAVGHVSRGTTPLETAHRELKEEVGFDTPLTFIEKEYIRYKYSSYFVYRYIGKYTGQQVIMNTEELADVRFVDKEEFDIMIELGMPFSKGSLAFITRFWAGEFDLIKAKN